MVLVLLYWNTWVHVHCIWPIWSWCIPVSLCFYWAGRQNKYKCTFCLTMYRCESYGSQWRCGCCPSKPTSQFAAGHHDASQCEQPKVGSSTNATKVFAESFTRNQFISGFFHFYNQILKRIFKNICVGFPSLTVWWMMLVGLGPCPQQPLPLPQAKRNCGTRTLHRIFEITWCTSCMYQQNTVSKCVVYTFKFYELVFQKHLQLWITLGFPKRFSKEHLLEGIRLWFGFLIAALVKQLKFSNPVWLWTPCWSVANGRHSQ